MDNVKLCLTVKFPAARSEILTAVNFQIVVFWAVMSCSDVMGQPRFREPCFRVILKTVMPPKR